MGHTIPSKRYVIYGKLNQLKSFSRSLRQPYRDRFVSLINDVYPHISSIVYTNSLDDEEMMVYAMLIKISGRPTTKNKDKLFRCLSILLSAPG